jgi:hypothetical protein
MTEEPNEESRIMNQAKEEGISEEIDEQEQERKQFELLKEKMTRTS